MRLMGLICSIICMLGICRAQGFGEAQLLRNDWHFHLGDVKYGEVEYFDDNNWRIVDIPHDWSVEGPASPQLYSCTGYLPGGIGWYRKELEIPGEMKGKSVYIYFEGVYNNSEVFINGKWLGKRPNGYVPFMYDLSPHINFGGRNVLAVRVDHSREADSRWYTGSGIYRNVYLVYTDPVHIAQWGVYYTTRILGSRKAEVNIRTTVQNTTKVAATIRVLQKLYTADGKMVGTGTKTLKVEPGQFKTVQQKVQIPFVRLWSLERPYLYTLKTHLQRGKTLIDSSRVQVGIRTLHFNPEEGFALNGKKMKLKGVCLHHDAGALGTAVPEAVWRDRLMKLKEIGCNAIRMSHNPQAPLLYDLCDEIGFLVKDEAFDEWEYPKKKWLTGWNRGEPGFQGYADYFWEWYEADLRDMVLCNRNHPSVVMWSIGNEIDYPNDPYSFPILEEKGITQIHTPGYRKQHPQAQRLGEIAQALARIVRIYDRSRPVTAALAGPVMSNETAYPGTLDVVGYNYTESRYQMDHEKYPERILYGSETGRNFEAWKTVRDNDFIFGQFIWTGCDYLGESMPWPSRGLMTGMIDYAGNIKPIGYFRKSLWVTEPMVYIGTYKVPDKPEKPRDYAPRLWNYETGEKIRVVCYTNCEQAELKLNGKQVGSRQSYDDNTGILFWDIPYEEGELEVVAFRGGRTVAGDKILTSGRPYALKVVQEPAAWTYYDVVPVRIEIVDEKDYPVILADNLVSCELSGDIRLLAMENGTDDATENFRNGKLRCVNGKVVAYIQSMGKNGKAKVKFTSPLLRSATLEIDLK